MVRRIAVIDDNGDTIELDVSDDTAATIYELRQLKAAYGRLAAAMRVKNG